MSLSILNKLEAWLAGLAFGLIVVGIVGVSAFLHQYHQRFYPGIYVDGVDIGGLTLSQARAKLPNESQTSEKIVEIYVETISIASSSSQLGLQRNYDRALDTAMAYGKDGWLGEKLLTALDLRFRPIHFASALRYDEAAVAELVESLANQVDIAFVESFAELKVRQSPNSLVIHPGQIGRRINQTQTAERIMAQAVALESKIAAPVASVGAELSPEQQVAARERAVTLVGDKILLRSSDSSIQLADAELIDLLAFPEGFSEIKLQALMDSWQTQINRPPQDAEFVYDPTSLRVTSFIPSRDGLGLDVNTTTERLVAALQQLEQPDSQQSLDIELALQKTPPTTSLGDTNDLGVKELIGLGESEYDHSIPNRIYNVALTASKITNYILKPGEEFSFNQVLGDVSAETGFQPAYVIKNGQTVLGDGGGVCQVSTTLFRAVLDAGLDVTKRRAHSYRVSYYELNSLPGVDATVYSGDVDLRFINDTGHYLLIHTETNSDDLYMKIELYGTSDGRTTEIINHRTWDYRPAPPPVYIPDPTLPPGKLTQVDWAASGIRATFTNVITDKDGNIIREDTYNSNYIPWSAKYLQGVVQ